MKYGPRRPAWPGGALKNCLLREPRRSRSIDCIWWRTRSRFSFRESMALGMATLIVSLQIQYRNSNSAPVLSSWNRLLSGHTPPACRSLQFGLQKLAKWCIVVIRQRNVVISPQGGIVIFEKEIETVSHIVPTELQN